MSLELDLPEDLAEQLQGEADELGLTLSDYILQVLAREKKGGVLPRTGVDLVAYWNQEGVVGFRPEIADPSKHARTLRGEAQQRHRD